MLSYLILNNIGLQEIVRLGTQTCPLQQQPSALSQIIHSSLPLQRWSIPAVCTNRCIYLFSLNHPLIQVGAPDQGCPSKIGSRNNLSTRVLLRVFVKHWFKFSCFENKTWKAMWRRCTVRRAAFRRNLRKLYLVLCNHSSSFDIAIICKRKFVTKQYQVNFSLTEQNVLFKLLAPWPPSSPFPASCKPLVYGSRSRCSFRDE